MPGGAGRVSESGSARDGLARRSTPRAFRSLQAGRAADAACYPVRMSRPSPGTRSVRAHALCLLVVLGAVSAHAGAPARATSAPGRGWAHPWGRDAIVYGVVPSLFGKQPFRDVTARLPQLKELGVNTVWLSPVNATIPDDFGYSVTGYFDLREDYGTKADFRALVMRAHELGMHVIMDFVPNHTAREHAFFQDALKRGKDSPYHAFYDWKAPGQPEHYFNWTHLPNLDFDNPRVDDMVIDALEYWVRDFDVDGYRLDVAWGIKERDPGLWPRVRTALEVLEPQVFLVAEASAKDPYYFRHGFDAAYDWTREPGKWAWEKVWEEPARIAPRLREALADARTPPAGMVMRFLNNNDTGERFITRHGPDMTRAAAALLFTLPGIPLVYTGDEVGAAYMPYESPAPLDWAQDPHRLRPYYARLIALRGRLAALRSPRFALAEARPESALAYVRTRDDGSEPVLVVFNWDARPQTVHVKPPPGFRGAVRDALSEAPAAVHATAEGLTLELPAWGVRVLTPGR
jgi:cyclomaltodextrinase